MKFIAILVTFASFAFAENIPERLVDYRLALSETMVTKNCTAAGVFCDSCNTLVSCVQDTTDGSFTKKIIATCSSPEKCITDTCTTGYDYVCDNVVDLAFPCTTAGIFPDPFYCNKFVMCVEVAAKLQPYHSTCEDGYKFNVKNDLCDIRLDSGSCPVGDYPVPICNEAGEVEAFSDKPSMYYQCQEYSTTKRVLYPVVHLCPHGGNYANYKCTDAS